MIIRIFALFALLQVSSSLIAIENHDPINIAKADQYIQSIVDEMLKNQRIDQAITRILNIASEKDENSRALTCGISQKLFVESIIRRTELIDEGKFGMANINMQYEIELGKYLLNSCTDLLSLEARNEIERTNKNTMQLLNKIKSITAQ